MHKLKQVVLGCVVVMGVSLGLFVTGAQAQSGSLQPPPLAVDPFGSGNPVATTQTQPSWDQSLPASERFKRVLPTASKPFGAAVLDRETSLVWEGVVQTTTHTWNSARLQCMSRTVGDKKGWRLPSVHELASLVDLTNSSGNPDIPAGAPFVGVLGSMPGARILAG